MHTLHNPDQIREFHKKGLISIPDYQRYLRIIYNRDNLVKAAQSIPLAGNAIKQIEENHQAEFQRVIKEGRLQYELRTNVQFVSSGNPNQLQKSNVLKKASNTSSFASRRIQNAYEFDKKQRDLVTKADELLAIAKRTSQRMNRK